MRHPQCGQGALRQEIAFISAVKAVIAKYTTVDQKRSDEDKRSALKQILDNAIVAGGVANIFALAGLEKPNIGLLSDEFLEDIRKMDNRNLAAELLEKLLRDEIRASTKTNVVREKKYGDRLLETLRKYHNRAIETAQIIEELIQMARDFRKELENNVSIAWAVTVPTQCRQTQSMRRVVSEIESTIQRVGDVGGIGQPQQAGPFQTSEFIGVRRFLLQRLTRTRLANACCEYTVGFTGRPLAGKRAIEGGFSGRWV